MPKVREIVHGFGQKGVPADMTAVTQDRAAKRREEIKDSFFDIDLRKSLIMEYVRENEGQPMRVIDLGTAARYKDPIGASTTVRRMIEDGLLEMTYTPDGKRTYYDKRLMKKRIAEEQKAMNGVTTENIPKPSQETVDHLQKVHEQAEKGRQEAENQLLTVIDTHIWEFLRTNGVYEGNSMKTAYTFQALADFSHYLHNKK